ncbi:MAG: hypothetical protein Q9225_007876 [Loekoesia sp. 1 TL-2023]
MRNYKNATRYYTPRRPACRSVQKSWDFMAPELVRPLAVTYVGDIAVIVQRLGMKWQAFRPEEGEMRAEGNGHIIYSTLVRSIGPILHYAHELTRDMVLDKYKKNWLGNSQPSKLIPPELLFIPTSEVDMMRFGMLPCYEDFMHRKYYAMGTIDEVSATLDLLDPSGSASQKVQDNRRFVSTSTFGFSDLISMAAPILRQKGSTRIRLPVPTEHCTGLTSHKEGFVIFRQRLGEYFHDKGNEASPQILWVLQNYDSLKTTYPNWEEGTDEGVCENHLKLPFLDKVHGVWNQTTEYFQQLHTSDEFNFQYAKLVAYHIKHAVNFWHEAHERIRDGGERDHHGLRDWLAEGMHLYWDYLPRIVGEIALRYRIPDSVIREAWIMLMFRASCWSRCHYMCRAEERFPDSARLPSRYWSSKLPVYLG